MVPFAGFEMPVQYKGVVPEHLCVRQAAGLFDVSHMGEVRVRGPQAGAALQWLLSNDITKLAPGQAQYNGLCNAQGGMVDDVFVNASNRAKDFAWMTDHNPFPAGAVFTDEGDDWAQVAIQGPLAVEVVAALTDAPVRELGRHRFLAATFAGVEGCLVARTGYTGEDGFEVFLPSSTAEPAWQRILDAGAPHGLQPIGLGARDTLRLEAKNVLYGHEINEETSPLSAGLGWITKVKKEGGFLGCDAIVARKDTDPRKLVGLVLDGKRIARDGMSVSLDGRVVGTVTSGTLAPFLGKPVALAMVDRALAVPGQALVIDVRGNDAVGVVVDGPFYKRS
jgi:aminomethyltransferase